VNALRTGWRALLGAPGLSVTAVVAVVVVGLGAGVASAQPSNDDFAATDATAGFDEAAYVDARPVVAFKTSGNRRTESEAILKQVKLKVGERASREILRRDIQRLFDLKLFENVSVYAEDSDDGEGVVLIFKVVERPTIQRVEFVGNDEIDEDDIKKAIDIKPFSILDMNKVNTNRQKIVDLYSEKGFFLSEVEARVVAAEPPEPDPDADVTNERIVRFVINERAKVTVKKITFIGNEKLSDTQLKDVLETREGGWLSFITSGGKYKAEAFSRDLMRIQALYYDNGYLKVKVGEPRVTLSPDKNHLFISVFIEEGEQFTVGKLDFQGDLMFEKSELLSYMNSKPGETFNRSKLAQDIEEKLGDLYRDEGYAFVNITPLTQADDATRIVDITFDIQRGEKVYYERIEIVGNSKTRDKVIRREMYISEGELTNATKFKRSKVGITRLGFFETVELTTKRGSDDTKQIVIVTVAEKPTGQFLVGAGFSSIQQFFVQAQVSQNNLFGRGQSLSLNVQVSGFNQLYNVQFVEPYLFDTKWYFGINLRRSFDNYFNFIRRSTGGDITFGYPITPELRLFAGYNLEMVEAEPVQSSSSQRVRNLFLNGLTSSLTFSAQYDTRNNRLMPTDGMLHSLAVEVASSIFGSQNVFTRFTHTSRFYVPLPLGLVFKTNIRTGFITSTAATGVPVFERYYVGGINTVRGYALRSLSPTRKIAINGTDPQSPMVDFAVGGDKQLIINLELEYPIFTPLGLRGVIFADAGNAYDNDEFFFIDKGDNRARGSPINRPPLGLYPSVGLGVRWQSPIGPLRFEWGFPLYRRRNPANPSEYLDATNLFEFTIGNSF
jgi:outer membrane protein insertion porin family